MTERYTIILNEKESAMVEKLVRDRGYRKQDLFRFRLRELYNKEFPPYNESKRNKAWHEDYTNEMYCVRIKEGKVEGKFCVIERNGEIDKIPLKEIKYSE